ncbi:MAG: glycosyltransferase family 39 protein [Candidatus Eisenbacteria bacterium]|nr:glycosyltransferase family 39 protein [Candidatus Eisenbacteria bacterium]
MRFVKALALGAAFFALCWLVGGWGLPSAERAAFYPGDAPVHYARSGAPGAYVTGPAKSFHPDEASILGALAAMRPSARDFNPHFFNYPSLHIYAVGGALALAQNRRWIPASRDAAHYLASPADAAKLYRTGRAVSALWAAVLLMALYFASEAGLAAALILACAPLFLACAASMTVDMAAASLATVAALAAARSRAPGRWHALGLGLLAGLAASAKYPAAIAFLPVAYACVGPAQRARDRAGSLMTATVGALGGFLAGTPYALLSPAEFLAGVRAEWGHGSAAHGYQFMDAGPAWRFHLDHTFLSGCGLPFTLFLVGMLGCLLDFNARRQALFLFSAAWVALLLSANLHFARYALPALPVAALLAAEGWALLLARLGADRGPMSGILAALPILPQGALALAYVLVMLGPDPRLLAARAIAGWPAGTRVHLLEPPYFTTPPMDLSRLDVRVGPLDLDTLRTYAPQAVVASEFELRDLARLGSRLPSQSRAATALLTPRDTLRAGAEAWVGTEFARPATLAGWSAPTRAEPQELVMLHPTIYVWRRLY